MLDCRLVAGAVGGFAVAVGVTPATAGEATPVGPSQRMSGVDDAVAADLAVAIGLPRAAGAVGAVGAVAMGVPIDLDTPAGAMGLAIEAVSPALGGRGAVFSGSVLPGGGVAGGGRFVAARVGDAVAGSLWTGAGVFDLRPTGRLSAAGEPLVEVVDLAGLGLAGCGVGDRERHARAAALDLGPGAGHAAGVGRAGGLVDPENRVRVLIGITPTAVLEMGGVASAEATALAAVAATNDAYALSEVSNGLRVEVAGILSDVSAQPAPSSLSLLRRVANESDGEMDELFRARDAVGADLVAVLGENESFVCGVAFFAVDLERFGYSVTSWPCAVGNLTFAHELGHNYGLSHDIDNTGTPITPYAVGWNWDGLSGQAWRSVMSTSSDGGFRFRVGRFSNPGVLFDGVPTGDASFGDNTRWLEESSPTVSQFRVGPGDPTDCDGNGVADSLEVALDPSLDAGADGVLDICQVFDGSLEDCDNNGVADDAETSPRVSLDLPPADLLFDGVQNLPAFRTLTGLPEALSPVTVTLQAHGDFSRVDEFVDVTLNGAPVGRLYDSELADCVTALPAVSFTVSAAEWNAGGGSAGFAFLPSAEVNPELCGEPRPSYVGGRIEYRSVDRSIDADTDGVPDVCAVACNAADLVAPLGVLDLADVDAFILAFGIGDALADIAPNFGVLDLADIDLFINLFLGGCP